MTYIAVLRDKVQSGEAPHSEELWFPLIIQDSELQIEGILRLIQR